MTDRLSILIIDDNPDDREHYIRALKKVEESVYRCLEATDGKQGLEAIESRRFDCVLLDYSLPGMNGMDVLRVIRGKHPLLPVLLLTGQGNEAVAVEAIKEGAYDYLTKSSLNPERLHQTIASAIAQAMLKNSIAEIKTQVQEKTLELALSEERYDLAVRVLSVGIWDKNIRTNRLYCSERFKEILELSDEDIPEMENIGIYKLWEARLHPDDRDWVLETRQAHIEHKGPYDVQYRLRRKDGSYMWIQAKGQAVWDENDIAVRMVGSIEDITWRKEAEVERERMINKLTESNSELERFAYICSHDLQEPLRMISSFTQRLEQHLGVLLDDRGRHYMHYVTEGAQQARKLISDVLNYARVDHEPELLSNIDSNQVLVSVLQDLSARIEETGAVVTYDPLPEVHMQPTHLRQLLQNIIGNALKFCTQEPKIHVYATRDGTYWCFSVRDNGIGIAAAHLDKIFWIFQRLHSRDRYPGTGIGLALCKKLTQKYGGKIWLESMPGVGSTFFFTLPSAAHHKEAA